MYQALLDHPALAATDFSSLRICISGGAPMAAELREKFAAATGASLVEGYGLTASSGVVATNPYAGPVRPGTIGKPLPTTNIRDRKSTAEVQSVSAHVYHGVGRIIKTKKK